MIPSTQVCKTCKLEKVNIEFEIISKTKIANVCLECASKPCETVVKQSNVSRETAVKRGKREPKGAGKPYVEAQGASVLTSTKRQIDDLKRIREANAKFNPQQRKEFKPKVIKLPRTDKEVRRLQRQIEQIGGALGHVTIREPLEFPGYLVSTDERIFTFGGLRISDNRRARSWAYAESDE